jgi:pimeloyl-ACP methyl ester carboxylesterase
MRAGLCLALSLLAGALITAPAQVHAEPAVKVVGQDFVFQNRIDGLPSRLSDFKDLEINRFVTNDGVTLSYWEAGKGPPLIFIPGWSANGAEYVNLMYLLAKRHRVIVLDPRNQGLSQRVGYGNRISRYAMDLKQLVDHLNIRQGDFCGWSMGASVLWGYVDLFGTSSIGKLAFVDEPISIVAHSDWSQHEREQAGAIAPSPEALLAALGAKPPTNPDPNDPNLLTRMMLMDSPYFANSESFARTVVKDDPHYAGLVLYDHASNDWRDVVRNKIDRPTAIFTGEWSANVPSQKWAHSVIARSRLFIYSKADQGDHFLMFKNPRKFAADLEGFLGDKQ